MTAEYAPDAIEDAFARLDEARPDWKLALGGILGTAASNHLYGYHRSRNWCARWSTWRPVDYSITRPDDKLGDGNAVSALDITPQGANADDVMATMTGRLLRAVDSGDPRAKYLAEFYGTLNGSSVVGRMYGSPASADSSHTWHLHVASRRRYANDRQAWAAIVDILLGVPFQYPPDHERFTDTMNEQQLRGIVRDEIRDALQAVEFGGPRGYWTEKTAGHLVPPDDGGDRERLAALERRVAAIEADSVS